MLMHINGSEKFIFCIDRFFLSSISRWRRNGRVAGGYSFLELSKPERTILVCPVKAEDYDAAPDAGVCDPDELLHSLKSCHDEA